MTFEYVDENGRKLYDRCRERNPRFQFYDRHGNPIERPKHVRFVPYRLPDLLKASDVVVCSNEYTAHELTAMGLVATTFHCHGNHGHFFSGKHAAIMSLTGHFSARAQRQVTPYAASVRMIGLTEIAVALLNAPVIKIHGTPSVCLIPEVTTCTQ